MSKRALPLSLPLIFSLAFPIAASAQTIGLIMGSFINLFSLLIYVIMLLAVLVFFWGIVKVIMNSGDERALAEGKQFMIWGMVALFVMVALWAIVGFMQQELGLDGGATLPDLPQQNENIPTPR